MGVRTRSPVVAAVCALAVVLLVTVPPQSDATVAAQLAAAAGQVKVTARVESAVVSWRTRARAYRVQLRTPNRKWHTVVTTPRRQVRVSELQPDLRYRVRILGKRDGRWSRIARPSAWFVPRAAPSSPSPTPAPTPQPDPSQSPPEATTPSPWIEPGVTPPTQAIVSWVSPLGDDAAVGSEDSPLRTITEAWRRIPQGASLTAPHWIQVQPGTYSATEIPNYWEERHGTAANPIVVNAPNGGVTLSGDVNAFDVRYLTWRGIDIVRSGDTFHCERCSNIQIRDVRLAGGGSAHETVKINQSDHILIDGSDISGAYENAIDFVAVQYATISDNRIHHSEDWCAYVKGGSVGVVVQGNEIHDCGTGGFTAGQGTGFEFMVAPWLRYEAYAVSVIDNVIHDTYGAGLGVNGGANILMAYNTLYRVGARSHTVEFVHGSRSCDGDTATCRRHHDLGGWGNAGLDGQWIPSRRIAFVNNLVFNPPGVSSQWSHLQVADATDPPAGSNVPAPSLADDELVIRGNVFRNGTAEMDSGWSDDAEFWAANHVNDMTVDLVDPAGGDFRPVAGGHIATLVSVPIPTHAWVDSAVPSVEPPALDTARPPGARRP